MLLVAIGLKVPIFFEKVVHPKHEVIVRRAHGEMEPFFHLSLPSLDPRSGGPLGERDSMFAGVLGGEFFERDRGHPAAAFDGVDIGKKAENPISMERPRGKGVYVEKVVARSRAKGAPLLLKRAETGIIDFPVGSIRRQDAGQKVGHSVRIIAEVLPHFFGMFGIFGIVIGDLIVLRLVCNILPRSRSALLLLQEKVDLFLREQKRDLREEEDVGLFQGFAVGKAIFLFGPFRLLHPYLLSHDHPCSLRSPS